MYDELIAPIANLGAEDHITATQLRNCLGKVAAAIGNCDGVEQIPIETEPETETADTPEGLFDGNTASESADTVETGSAAGETPG